MEEIFNEIKNERCYQCEKWGDDFDDLNTINDWAVYINHYLAKATSMMAYKEEQRKNFIKVATLAVAAIEAFDRNRGFPPRHYD